MANEFKHKDPGAELTQAEFIAACGDGHIFACQATGDILYASSATVLKNLGKQAAGTILNMGCSCIPAWTASPSVTDLTISGGCITLSAATDIDLIDDTACALSFDATGKAGIIAIVTTDCSEGVTMSGTLGVTGVLTATGGLAGGAIDNGTSNVTSGGTWSVDVDATGTDGACLSAAGTLRFGASQDLRVYHGGTNNYVTGVTGDLIIGTQGSGTGIILDAEDDTLEIKYSGAAGADFGTGGLNLVSGDVFSINCTEVLSGSALACAVKLNNANWSGTDLSVANGGTGASTFTANGILVGNGTSAVAVTATMATKGHVMVGDGSGVPTMLAVGGTCDHVLTVDSGEATGVKWAAVSGGNDGVIYAQPHSVGCTGTLATNYGYDGGASIGSASADGNVGFGIRIPTDYTTLTKAVMVVMPGQTGVFRYSVATEFGGDGQLRDTHSDSIAETDSASITAAIITEVDVAGALTGLAAGDRLGLRFRREGSDANDTITALYVWGLLIEYT